MTYERAVGAHVKKFQKVSLLNKHTYYTMSDFDRSSLTNTKQKKSEKKFYIFKQSGQHFAKN